MDCKRFQELRFLAVYDTVTDRAPHTMQVWSTAWWFDCCLLECNVYISLKRRHLIPVFLIIIRLQSALCHFLWIEPTRHRSMFTCSRYGFLRAFAFTVNILCFFTIKGTIRFDKCFDKGTAESHVIYLLSSVEINMKYLLDDLNSDARCRQANSLRIGSRCTLH